MKKRFKGIPESLKLIFYILVVFILYPIILPMFHDVWNRLTKIVYTGNANKNITITWLNRLNLLWFPIILKDSLMTRFSTSAFNLKKYE